MKLNQVLAIEKGAKTKSHRVISDVYKRLQNVGLLEGLNRTYQPHNDEDTDSLPPENKLIQYRVPELLGELREELEDFFNIVAAKEIANATASVNVILEDGSVFLTNVPVTYLLFLDKQLTDLITLLGAIPVLEPGIEWSFDPAVNGFRSTPVQTVRTKKIPKPITLAEATEHHPAQVQLFTEDVPVGTWTAVKMSSAIPLATRTAMVEAANELLRAVRIARETANESEAEKQTLAETIFNHILQPLVTLQQLH